MTLIIQTSRIPGRTASATWRGQHWDDLVAPSKLLAGDYLPQEAFELDSRFPAVSHHFGNRIIELAMRDSTDPVYLFAQSHSFGVNENTIGVPAELFDQLWAQVATGGFSLQLHRRKSTFKHTKEALSPENEPRAPLSPAGAFL